MTVLRYDTRISAYICLWNSFLRAPYAVNPLLSIGHEYPGMPGHITEHRKTTEGVTSSLE